jgi:hypothetical protein
LYRWTRDLHLYFGLFISPFILLFAASVFYLNHAKLIVIDDAAVETVRNLQVPDGLDRLKGRAAADQARSILQQLNVTGEIGFLRYVPRERRLVVPVLKADTEVTVEVDLDAKSASVTRRPLSLMESSSYLHKMPGPHNVAIRGNWIGIRVWRVLADLTIYLLLFISASGIYLWWAIKAERKIGLALLTAGGATLVGLVYVIVR